MQTEKFSRSVAAYLKNARYTGKSKKTLANYEKRLRLYGLFCADNDLREDDFRTVSAWRDSMLDAGMKPTSVSQYLNELKIFFTGGGMATHSSIVAWRIPMGRGAWRATAHGVINNWAKLS